MATQFQNRLIGTVILVSLGVIFLPDILSGKRSNHHDPIASIPLRPETAAALPVVSAATVTANPGAVSGAAVPDGVVVSNQASAAAADQWSVDEVAPTVTTGGDQAGQVVVATPGAVVASGSEVPKPAAVVKASTPDKPVATAAIQPASQPVAKPEQSKPVAAKPAAVKPVEPVAPTKPTLQAGQVKPFAEVAGTKPASVGVATPSRATQPAAQPKPYAQSKPAAVSGSAWVIQAGVFSSSGNANALVGKLRAGGLPANVSSFRSGGSLLYRVSVGPNASRAKLDSLVPRVSQIAGTAAKVVAYSPLG